MTPAWRAAAALAILALSTLLAAAPAQSPPPTETGRPLVNEDVVKMVAAGTPDREIVAMIETRPDAFDLSDDMMEELSRAGVPGTVLAAMRRKHAESAPATAATDRPPRGHVTLVVALNAGSPGSRTLKVPAWADEEVRARLQLPKDNEQRQVKDLAIFLACASPEHVPDQWRSKSPLGGDMVSTRRHQMLAFVPGDTPRGATPRVALPARLEADVDGNQAHDLVLGVAALIGDRWRQIATAKVAGVEVDAASKPLAGRVEKAGAGFAFKVELTAPR